jgi:hypothetical protein
MGNIHFLDVELHPPVWLLRNAYKELAEERFAIARKSQTYMLDMQGNMLTQLMYWFPSKNYPSSKSCPPSKTVPLGMADTRAYTNKKLFEKHGTKYAHSYNINFQFLFFC